MSVRCASIHEDCVLYGSPFLLLFSRKGALLSRPGVHYYMYAEGWEIALLLYLPSRLRGNKSGNWRNHSYPNVQLIFQENKYYSKIQTCRPRPLLYLSTYLATYLPTLWMTWSRFHSFDHQILVSRVVK